MKPDIMFPTDNSLALMIPLALMFPLLMLICFVNACCELLKFPTNKALAAFTVDALISLLTIMSVVLNLDIELADIKEVFIVLKEPVSTLMSTNEALAAVINEPVGFEALMFPVVTIPA